MPTLVEVKRSSDTRIRREVVGQMLDYAANGAVYWPLERLREFFARQCEREGRDADAVVVEVAGEEADSESSGSAPGERSAEADRGAVDGAHGNYLLRVSIAGCDRSARIFVIRSGSR